MFNYCNSIIEAFENVLISKNKVEYKGELYTGVDLGTAFIVMAVLNEKKEPLMGEVRYAEVVKDGLIVDYRGACDIVKDMKRKLEEKIGRELIYAATAVPPGTSEIDSASQRYVLEGAGFTVTKIIDEPTAANSLLKIKNGAIVDIGGGTTGIAIVNDGKVISTMDEPTGGTHFSLVLAGAYKISFDDAELIKRDYKRHKEIFPIVKPVIEKVSTIIRNNIRGYDIKNIYIVGGTSCLTGIEDVIEKELNIPVFKPKSPLYVTPVGIAMNCIIPIEGE